jgi:hypothetical protein
VDGLIQPPSRYFSSGDSDIANGTDAPDSKLGWSCPTEAQATPHSWARRPRLVHLKKRAQFGC